MIRPMSLWSPIAMSKRLGIKPLPFEFWLAWHFSVLLPTIVA